MLKVSEEKLEKMDLDYPGLKKTILFYESREIPICTNCGSENTAAIGGGIVGRSILLTSATTKFKLVPNKPPGTYYCNDCTGLFN